MFNLNVAVIGISEKFIIKYYKDVCLWLGFETWEDQQRLFLRFIL